MEKFMDYEFPFLKRATLNDLQIIYETMHDAYALNFKQKQRYNFSSNALVDIFQA